MRFRLVEERQLKYNRLNEDTSEDATLVSSSLEEMDAANVRKVVDILLRSTSPQSLQQIYQTVFPTIDSSISTKNINLITKKIVDTNDSNLVPKEEYLLDWKAPSRLVRALNIRHFLNRYRDLAKKVYEQIIMDLSQQDGFGDKAKQLLIQLIQALDSASTTKLKQQLVQQKIISEEEPEGEESGEEKSEDEQSEESEPEDKEETVVVKTSTQTQQSQAQQ